MNTTSSFSRALAWTLWIVLSIFYAYQYILRVMPSVMMNEIIERFEISTSTFGQFSGIYYIGYALMHLPLGIMLDRFGLKRMMTACILCTVIGLLPLSLSSGWIYPIIGRLLVGLGSSAAVLGLFKVIRLAFAEKYFSRFIGLSVTIGLIGAIYGGKPLNELKEIFGFDSVVQLLALMGVSLACITFWVIPNTKTPSTTSVLSDISEVLGNKKVILCSLSAGLMVGPLEGFADVWGTSFLKQVYGFDASLASALSSTLFIGMCFGAPILGYVAEKMGNLLITIFAAGISMAVCFSLLLYTRLNPSILSFSFIFVGVCSAYQILVIQKTSSFVREHVVGLTMASVNMIVMLFGYLFHTLIGSIISALGGSSSPTALLWGIAVIPFGLVMGSLGFLSLLIYEKKDRLDPVPSQPI